LIRAVRGRIVEAAGSEAIPAAEKWGWQLSSGEEPTVKGHVSRWSSSDGPPRVFISYLQDDAAAVAMILGERLAARLGEENVFIDARERGRGVDWLEEIEKVEVSDLVFIALIGPGWIASLRRHRQAFRPGWIARRRRRRQAVTSGMDEVLEEIRVALRRGAQVVPVLVDDAAMPAVDGLPRSIHRIATLNAALLRSSTLEQDVERLIAALERPDWPRVEVPAMAEAEAAPRAGSEQPATSVGRRGEADLPRLLRNAARGGVVLVGSREEGQGREMMRPERWERRRASRQKPPTRRADEAARAQAEAARPTAPKHREPSRASASASASPPPTAKRRSRARRSAGGLLTAAGILAVIKWITGFPLAADSGELVGSSEDEDVDCTVFAPRSLRHAESSLVQVFLHPRADAAYAAARAQEADPGAEVRIARCLDCSVRVGARVRVELRAPGAWVERTVESIIWRGTPEVAQFEVAVMDRAITGLVATVSITVDREPVGRLKFKLAVGYGPPVAPEPVGDSARNYRAAFISYASQDRDKVLLWRRMARRFELKVFQDRVDLEPGDRWSEVLERAIDDSDLFVLFWSLAAQRSDWVRREVRRALEHQGLDEEELPEIWPVILEGPPPAAPWKELSHLHFDDPLLYFAGPRDDE
jgi:hypothetical protein